MKVTAERQENCIVELTIAVDEQRTNELLRRAARALSRRYRIPGFRPGKAPYNVIVRRLGIEAVQSQTFEQFGDEIFKEGLEESGLEPIDQASLEDITWDPFTLHLKVPVGPEVYLGAYRDIRIPWQEPQVSDEQLDEALLRLQKEQTEWQPGDRPAELGDRVVMDITAKVDGEVVLQNTARQMVLSAESPYPLPGFAEAVVGIEPGETREFTLTYPEDHYNADIAGKEGHFEVRLQEIQVEILPLLDDEFAMSVGDYESLDDLKAKLRQSLLEEAERQAEEAFEEQLWGKLLEVASVEYPDAYVEREVDALQGQLEQQLQRQNLDLTSYFQLTNTTQETWRVQVRPQAEEQLKRRLMLAEVVKQEELQVEDQEIDAEIAKLLESMGESAAEMRQILETPAGRATIGDSLLREKAMDRLKALSRAEEVGEKVETAPPEGEAPQPAEAVTEEEAEPAAETTAAAAETTEPEAPLEAEAEPEGEATSELQAEAEAGEVDSPQAEVEEQAEGTSEPVAEARTEQETVTARQDAAEREAKEPSAETADAAADQSPTPEGIPE